MCGIESKINIKYIVRIKVTCKVGKVFTEHKIKWIKHGGTIRYWGEKKNQSLDGQNKKIKKIKKNQSLEDSECKSQIRHNTRLED